MDCEEAARQNLITQEMPTSNKYYRARCSNNEEGDVGIVYRLFFCSATMEDNNLARSILGTVLPKFLLNVQLREDERIRKEVNYSSAALCTKQPCSLQKLENSDLPILGCNAYDLVSKDHIVSLLLLQQ